jgi:Spy/CpxP family protein refolding chaperone
MKSLFSLIFAALLVLGGTALAVAQDRSPAPSVNDAQKPRSSYSEVIKGLFAPITDQLSLTKEQEFQIIAIISGTEAKADPIDHELENLDQQLSQAVLIDSPDEATISRLAANEATLITQMITMKALANASIYQLLTPKQRGLVSRQFRGDSPAKGYLGAISVY